MAVKQRIRNRLVDDLRGIWKQWSTQLNAAGLFIYGLYFIDPQILLGVWNMMPSHIRPYLPQNLLLIVGALLWGGALLGKMVKQPKLQKGKTDGDE